MKKWGTVVNCCCWMLLMSTSVCRANEMMAVPFKADKGDTVFVLICTVMAMIMTPAGGIFYGGMVRRKNVLSVMMQTLFMMAVISLQWIAWGYSLAFGPDCNGIIGSLAWAGLMNVGSEPNPEYAATIPHIVFMIFQAMFAIVAPALLIGSFAERVKFPAFILFVVLWSTFIYDPVTHWIWGTGGWLRTLGVLDFAGGTVVHILSGVSGLVLALLIGPRKDYGKKAMLPHHLPMTMLGASLLWFGWLGFNAGSTLAANPLAANVFVVTQLAGAAAMLSWLAAEWIHRTKPTVFGAVSGCIAGLVAITPAAGYVDPLASVVIGTIAGIFCYGGVCIVKEKFGYDDALDAFGINGIGGTWGALATGLFASKAVNPLGADGLFYGNPSQVVIQLIGTGTSWCVAVIGTFVIVKSLMMLMKVRVDIVQEMKGLDISEHGERGYDYRRL